MGIKQALRLDKLNGNTLWQDAIAKELQQLTDYRILRLPEPGGVLSEYNKIPYHIVFDVKFYLRRKSRLVAGGNWTNPEKDDIYSGVVAMESVRIGFLVGELNGQTCCAGDVGNAFLYDRTKEKVYIIAGPEFSKELEGKVLNLLKSLYGMRTSAAKLREHLVERLRTMGFTPSKGDFNFFMSDKGDHYEYLATYVDDVLVWSKDPMSVIKILKKTYIMKGVGVPSYYLGGDVKYLDQHWQEDGISLALSAKTYMEHVIPKFEQLLGGSFGTYKSLMVEGCHPEINDSQLLNPEEASKFHSVNR